MSFPQVPNEEISIDAQSIQRNIHALYVYLNRLRFSATDTVISSIEDNGGVTEALITDHSVSYVKLQNENPNTILGRVITLGTVEELTLGTNLFFSGTTVNASTAIDREVSSTDVISIQDTFCVVSSRYFRILGSFSLLGDATLEIL